MGTGNGFRVGDFNTIGGGQIYATSNIISGGGEFQTYNTNVFNFGANVAKADGATGRIGYGTYAANCLCIVGGSTSGTRSIVMWDYVGIGGIVPSYPLHVNASGAYAYVTNGLIYNSGIYLSTQSYSRYISIKSENSVWTSDYFLYSSDERIKKNIRDINDDIALQKILLIQPKLYNYVDVTRQGENDVIGFIAQQVSEVECLAVTTQKEFIPNIYKSVDIIDDVFDLEQNILKVDDDIQIWHLEGHTKSFKIISIIGNYITI